MVRAENGLPLPGANVALVDAVLGSTADLDGSYTFSAPPGSYQIRATFTGYEVAEESITVLSGQTVRVDFVLLERIAEFGNVVVVVGSRATRTAIETPVPIDVIPSESLEEHGVAELNQALRELAPSFNASHQTIADGSDHVNPISLRGLGPDQVLVLINGKRRHSSALVHVNGTFGRGTVGVDLNALPTSAVENVEVLRDGASAQYGSDAIAGVVNVVLKRQISDLEINVGTGVTGAGDGEMIQASTNYGFRIGEYGFFNVTGTLVDRKRTDRSEPWTGDIFPGITGTSATDAELGRRQLTREDFTMKTGQGEATLGSVFFNSAVPLNETAEFYAFGGLTHRTGEATGFFRLPNSEARVNLEVYPNGFLPEIHTRVQDQAITAGLKGIRNGWIVDLSATHGGNGFLYNIENTINASLGVSSPTSFDAGSLGFNQTTGNLDILRDLDTGGRFDALTLALGSEFRLEDYQIEAGQFESYSLGDGGTIPGVSFDTTAAGGPKAAGAQVFPGFQPLNEVGRHRYSISTYAEMELEANPRLFLTAAGRFESYSDFGQTLNGKLSGRYEFTPGYALRGAINTGFRAPSLHQLWFNNVSTQFLIDPDSGELIPSQVLTARNSDPITRAFGIPRLSEETSLNLSGGVTARLRPNLSVTADVYRIEIDDRIVLTSRFTTSDARIGAQVAQILAPFQRTGASAAQFFANAVDTQTQGLDIVTAYERRFGDARLSLTGAVNFTKTEVKNINIPQSVADRFAGGDLEAVRTTLFNREERNRLEDALPRQKGYLALRILRGPFNVAVRTNYYGSISYKPTNPDNDETFGTKILLDLNIGYEIADGIDLVVGADNLFNTFPDQHQKAVNLSNGRFPYSRRVTQYGMNGGFYYGRIVMKL